MESLGSGSGSSGAGGGAGFEVLFSASLLLVGRTVRRGAEVTVRDP